MLTVAKMKSLRIRFEDNYKPFEIPADNKRGKKTVYVYYAPWYIWDVAEAEFKQKKAVIAVLHIVSLALFLCIESIRTPVNNFKAVFACTAFAFCFHIAEMAALIDFLSAKSRTTKIKFENISRGFEFFTAVRAGLLAAGTLFSVTYMFAGNVSVPSAAVAVGLFACAIMAWAERKIYKAIPFYTEKNDTYKKYSALSEEWKSKEE